MAGFLDSGINTETWFEEAKEVFSDKSYQQKKSIPSFKIAFKELNRLYKEHLASWWEVQSLDNYIRQGIVPRGLRISVTPVQKQRSPGFTTRWEQLATKSSLQLMTLLLEEERLNLTSLTDKLKTQIEVTKTFVGDPEFQNKEKQLQVTVEKYQYYLRERKHRQFNKDLAEFKENKAYSVLKEVIPKENTSEISTTDTELSDSERESGGNPNRNKSKNFNKRGRGRGRGRGTTGPNKTVFLDQGVSYPLRNRPITRDPSGQK